MNCPACNTGLPAGPHERCPFCGTRLAAPVEGALAAEPEPVTPNPREPQPPIRDIPGLRKRERTWKDEVRDRVRERRERRAGELPLFREQTGEESDRLEAEDTIPAAAEAPAVEWRAPEPRLHDEDRSDPVGPRELGEPEPADLPLRPAPELDVPARPLPARREDAPPVERPALPFERLMAAVVDLAVVAAMWAVVVYFASRVARVPLTGLWPAWPWLAGYLVALGLLYAGYFTGTTGQTPGKMAHRLHVLDLAGGPPGHARAVARALLGSLGVLLAGSALLPMLFDPARRALHDRLLRTRVIRL